MATAVKHDSEEDDVGNDGKSGSEGEAPPEPKLGAVTYRYANTPGATLPLTTTLI